MQKCRCQHPSQSGVSLVELSISIAIIGLLIATVTTGFNMVHSAKLRKVVVEFTSFHTAVAEFEETYGYLPGDMPTAFNFWGADCGANATGTAGDCNGDGDGYVEFAETTAGMPQEDLLALEHLAFADYISGSYTGENASASARYALRTNTPTSEPFNNAGYMFRTEADSGGDRIYNTRGHTIRMGNLVDESVTRQQYPVGGMVAAKDAYSIDMKIDDGNASSGMFYSIREPIAASSGCVNNTWVNPSADYDLDSPEETCNLIYWYKKL